MPTLVVIDANGDEHKAKVDAGIDLIDACEEAGVSLPHSCGRGGWCSTCAVTVLEGQIGKDLFPAMGPEELESMESNGLDPKTQVLSCSCQILGDVKVRAAGCQDG
jgi:ferredoxin